MRSKQIRSLQNPSFKKFLRLLTSQGIRKYGLALISGPKQVKEVLRDFPERCEGVLLREDHELPELSFQHNIWTYCFSSSLFDKIDAYGTRQPILCVKVGPLPAWNSRRRVQGCTLFIPFQEPGNVGAAIRSGAAFGVSGIVILKEAAHPYHPKSTRAAGSTLFRVKLLKGPSINDLYRSGIALVQLSPKGKNINRYRFPSSFGLLPGLEGPGHPAGLKGAPAVRIPMEPGVESLNAAMATGIALYLWRTRLRK